MKGIGLQVSLVTFFRTLCAMAALALAAPVAASESAWVRHPEIALRLISGSAASGDGGALRLGLEMRLSPGWKTYWRTPGDAGLPPTIDWAGSANLADANLRFPAPERFTLFGFETFGYGGHLILPIVARAPGPGETKIRAGVDVLVCEKLCIPYRADLALDLPAGAQAPSAHTHEIAKFESAVPQVDESGQGVNGLTVESAAFRGGDKPALIVRARAEPPFSAPDLFVEAADGWSFAKPEIAFLEGGRYATLTIAAAAEKSAPPLDGARATLTLIDGKRAVERAVTLGAAPPAPLHATSLVAMLAIAVLGGLILNLMPCVLPVLAMKVAGLAKLAGAPSRRLRISFLATSAGIVTSFLLLAAALIALKSAGEAVGWGLQFQLPWFLAAMALVVTLFAANLWGLLEIPLPRALADAADGASASGSFATGVFATLLATPCSAPFVGTAIGFALARGPVEIAAIFAALGVGLALPYLAVAAAPGVARILPKPGAWMLKLRAVLGVALAGTALWLVWVLAQQAGQAAATGLAFVLGALVLGLHGLRGLARSQARPILIAACAVFAIVLPLRFAETPAASQAESAIPWREFDRAAIEDAVRGGKTVFVDVTAEWCVTCLVNKRLIVERGEVARRLVSGEVLAFRADWTRPDPRISAYLAEFGRYGIPFNAVYGPGAAGGLALPELLTEDAVLGAFARAAARS
ncbi:MAG: thioredoxin family protein [Tagaea sp.]|nr:thioredoxin family protein [Tagaea sp.]